MINIGWPDSTLLSLKGAATLTARELQIGSLHDNQLDQRASEIIGSCFIKISLIFNAISWCSF
jgi:hypothetical protein